MTPVDLREFVRDVPDFPKPGITFKDMTPLFLEPAALDAAVSGLADFARPLHVDFVLAAEARGFILGGALARELRTGFIPARKPGKLPGATLGAQYALEYGIDALEVHSDALSGGAQVLVHDDLLATGGTAAALCELVKGSGGEIAACAFVIELSFLDGRRRLGPHRVHTLVDYES